MTSHTKEIVNESAHRQETLRVRGGFEPVHLSLALSGRLMRDLRSIVLVLLGAVDKPFSPNLGHAGAPQPGAAHASHRAAQHQARSGSLQHQLALGSLSQKESPLTIASVIFLSISFHRIADHCLSWCHSPTSVVKLTRT